MNLIDTHTHLYLNQFKDDLDDVINNAINNNINKFLLPNINSETTASMIKICKKYPKNCYPMMGIHPCDVKKESIENEITHVKEMLDKYSFIAIGEIGIDLYWDKTTIDIQKDAFRAQIEIAKKHNLPIVIHVRDSFNETIDIVEELNDKNLSGVFHCFTGSIHEAQRIIDLNGFYLGIGGVLTFKNSGLDETIKNIDANHLLLETDAPFLAPTPYRGKRNESKYIKNIAEKLSEIHNLSLKDIAEITTQNAMNLFNLK